jgi:N6-adenosine-specific RNA methylase IME4
MLGTRGKVPAPAPGEHYPSTIEAPVTTHSTKPDAFAEMIEALFPTLPRIEMFARKKRQGWDRWATKRPKDPARSARRCRRETWADEQRVYRSGLGPL